MASLPKNNELTYENTQPGAEYGQTQYVPWQTIIDIPQGQQNNQTPNPQATDTPNRSIGLVLILIVALILIR